MTNYGSQGMYQDHVRTLARGLTAARAEAEALRAGWKEIASGSCPAKYPMTDRGLLEYSRDLARAALAKEKA